MMLCVKPNEPSEAVRKGNSDSPIRPKSKESPKAASKEPPNTAPKPQGDEIPSQEIELRLQDARSGRPFDPAVSTRGRPVLVGDPEVDEHARHMQYGVGNRGSIFDPVVMTHGGPVLVATSEANEDTPMASYDVKSEESIFGPFAMK